MPTTEVRSHFREGRPVRRHLRRYWLVGPTGADLGPDDLGYPKTRARQEAEMWIDSGVEVVEIVPVGARLRSKRKVAPVGGPFVFEEE